MEELETAYYDPEVQAQLAEDGKRYTDRLFLISEEIISTEMEA
jgi:hypothetical protein